MRNSSRDGKKKREERKEKVNEKDTIITIGRDGGVKLLHTQNIYGTCMHIKIALLKDQLQCLCMHVRTCTCIIHKLKKAL